ncbi:probable palmitoyltransferase ZDHHC11 isoform X1 [Papio anubis]|uniref:probable palmitoyltransferase ZDHHC11 isoform X1 n=1 Tax=Papio anubis TaxID=9555 RepID=UPI0012ADB1C8|nr:probable palmitoyltransferase ZDHHC11 isoform X1 [Papio anubis]
MHAHPTHIHTHSIPHSYTDTLTNIYTHSYMHSRTHTHSGTASFLPSHHVLVLTLPAVLPRYYRDSQLAPQGKRPPQPAQNSPVLYSGHPAESMPGTPCRFTGAPVRSPVLFTRKGVRRHGKPMMNRVYLHLGLRFKYLIHPQFMFVRSARWGSSFILPHVACELSQRHGSNRVSFPHLMIFVCLLKINWQ